ncbi:MAG: PEP-CTERM sorting domain-containing protein [Caulobacteraceae bacterium]
MNTVKTLIAIAGCAAALGLAAAPTAASADVHWTVNGTFDDGGTVTGSFDIDIYGYIDGATFDLKTAGGSLTPFEYTPATAYHASGTVPPPDYNTYVAPFYIDLQPGYAQALHLVFQSPLITPIGHNVLLGGYQGPSFECQNSYSCYVPQGDIRYIASGSARAAGVAVPEPTAWALMLTGFAGLGAMLRRARGHAAAVRA